MNAALFRVARDATRLNRSIVSLGELDNYRRWMWREEGYMQDRVPTTAGESNVFLDKWAVARVSYHTVALAGWTQPVRYSPYPRNTDGGRERFGCEKDGSVAGECEVHVHVGFPIPAREHAKIAPPPRCSLGRRMSLAGTEMSGLSSRRPRLSIRGDPVSPNPAILAAGFEDMLSVNRVGYVARRIGYDAEECIQKALEDNEIEVCKPSGDGHRRYGVYRLTAKGREALVKHMREAFQRSAEAARRRRGEEASADALPSPVADMSRSDDVKFV